MKNITVLGGTAHRIPGDLRDAISTDKKALDAWQSLTPLARNEWICWVISVKLDKTRGEHVKRAVTELKDGMRRPCCWMGCIHRKDKEISPSVQGILNKRSK